MSDSPSWTDTLQTIPAVQQRAHLAAALRMLRQEKEKLHRLGSRYKNGHAHVVRLQRDIAALEDTIHDLTVALVAELEVRESELQRDVAAVAARSASIRPQRLEGLALERRLKTAERFYEQIQARHREVQRVVASSMPNLRVFAWAVPPREPVGRAAQLQLVLGVSS